jgi:protein LTV1
MPKRFDKKNAVTYRLVHRSQRDPLLNDENSSPLVLLPVRGSGPNIFAETPKSDAEEDGSDLGSAEEETLELMVDPQKDASNFGVYFKNQDEYDYMQHLKVIGEDPSGVFIDNAPKEKKQGIQFVEESHAQVFGSKDELEVGIMNQEATMGLQVDLDPAIREAFVALDDEAYVEDLDDDFFEAFHQEELPSKYEQLQAIPEDEEVEFEDQEPWMKEFKKFQRDRNQGSDDEWSDDSGDHPATTQFSMSSSSMFRNEKLTLLDDQFDKILQDYSDEEIGELDPEDEELQGQYSVLDPDFHDEHLDKVFDSFLENLQLFGQKKRVVTRNPSENLDAIRKELKEDAKKLVEKYEEVEDLDEKPIVMPEPKQREQWDVQSVLSLHSNIYNRPKIIAEISKTAPKFKFKKGMPVVEEPGDSEEEDENDEPKGICF